MWPLLVQSAAAWYGAGFIWTMQILNYPLLARVGPDAIIDYEREHNKRFIRVVGPGVVATLVTTVMLLLSRPARLPAVGEPLVALLLLMIIASTAISQAPAHERLARGFDATVHKGLVRTNWLRTACWTAIGVIDVWLLAQLIA